MRPQVPRIGTGLLYTCKPHVTKGKAGREGREGEEAREKVRLPLAQVHRVDLRHSIMFPLRRWPMQARRWTSARCTGNFCRVNGALTSVVLRSFHTREGAKKGAERTNERINERTGVLPAIAHESRRTCVIWHCTLFYPSPPPFSLPPFLSRRNARTSQFTPLATRWHVHTVARGWAVECTRGFAPAHAEDLRQCWPDARPQGRRSHGDRRRRAPAERT